jgi:sporulation integral membrane protein YtvI
VKYLNTLLEKIDKLAIFFIVYTLIFITFFKTISYTLPFVLAFIFALILQKPTKFMVKKFKIKNSISAILTTFLFFAIIILITTLGIISLTNEAIQLVKNTQVYIIQNSNLIDKYMNILKNSYERVDPYIIDTIKSNMSSSISKLSNITAQIITSIVTWIINFFSSIPSIIMIIVFTFLSTYFFTRDLTSAKKKFLHIIPSGSTNKVLYMYSETKKMLVNYVLSYSIVVSITFLETLIGFSIFGVKYALILSILSAIFDVLPVLGTATVYIPIAIYYALYNNWIKAIGILILYAVVFIIRQILEPKIVSSSLGLHPVAILAAIFIGLKINGIAGMFYCMFLVIFYSILKTIKIL